MVENEIDLIEYFNIIWKRKYLIVFGTLIAGAIAAAVSFCLPKVYRATVTFLITSSPVVRGDKIEGPNFDILIETYRELIQSKSSLLAALKKFNLDQNPYHYSLMEMEKIVSVKPILNSKLIQLNVDLNDPQLATDIANSLANSATEINLRLNQGDTAEAQKFLNEEIGKAAAEFKSSEQEYLDFQKQARMDDLRKKSETLLGQKSNLSQLLTSSQIDLDSELGKVKRLEEEMKNRTPKITLKKSLTDDPAYQQLLSSNSSNQEKNFLHLSLESEAVNEAYAAMDQNLVATLGNTDYLKSRIEVLKTSATRIDRELKVSQIELARLTMEEQRLRNRYQLAGDIFRDLNRKLGEAHINIVSASQDLKILDPAILPFHPIKPRKSLIVLATLLAAAMLLTFSAYFLEYIQKTKERNDPAGNAVTRARGN